MLVQSINIKKFFQGKQMWKNNRQSLGTVQTHYDKKLIEKSSPLHQNDTPTVILKNAERKMDHYTHYNDVTMREMASQITSLTIVYSGVYSGAYQRKHQSPASLAFVRGIHRWPVNSPNKGQWRGKRFHLMTSSWWAIRRQMVRPRPQTPQGEPVAKYGTLLLIYNVNLPPRRQSVFRAVGKH